MELAVLLTLPERSTVSIIPVRPATHHCDRTAQTLLSNLSYRRLPDRQIELTTEAVHVARRAPVARCSRSAERLKKPDRRQALFTYKYYYY